MEYYQLDNGVKIIYKNIQSKLTSISIGLDAGAAVEKNIMGVAHATEHMVFKGTKTRNEQEINKIFHNSLYGGRSFFCNSSVYIVKLSLIIFML